MLTEPWSGVARCFASNEPGLTQTKTRFCKAATGKERIFFDITHGPNVAVASVVLAYFSEEKLVYATYVWCFKPLRSFISFCSFPLCDSSVSSRFLARYQTNMFHVKECETWAHNLWLRCISIPAHWCQSSKIPFSFGESTLMNLFTTALWEGTCPVFTCMYTRVCLKIRLHNWFQFVFY